MSNVGVRFATGTVLPTVPSSHSSPSPPAPPNFSLARKFAQFSSYLPNHRHFIAWCPKGLLSCCVAGHMRHSPSGVVWEQGKEQLSSSPGIHCPQETSPFLSPEEELASPQHVSPQSNLHLGTCSALCVEDTGFTGLSPPLTTSFVFFRAKSTANWPCPPQKG